MPAQGLVAKKVEAEPEAPKKEPKLKSPTSNDVGEQTKTKADK